jgi:hypothetical protein
MNAITEAGLTRVETYDPAELTALKEMARAAIAPSPHRWPLRKRLRFILIAALLSWMIPGLIGFLIFSR